MKILLHGINFAPELTGIGKYTGEMAAWLVRQGHEVRVVTAPPYYPDWQIAPGHSAWTCRRGQWQGVKIWRCPVWVPRRPGGLKRVGHLASFAVSSLPLMLRHVMWRPDVVWVVEPPLFCAPAAWLTARLSGAKAWLHVQDFEVDAAYELGLLKGKWMRRIAQWCETRIMRRFDVVSTISSAMYSRLADKGVTTDKSVLFPNWVDLTAIQPQSGPNEFRELLGIAPHQVVALYSGNMGAKQGLELLADVAHRLRDQADIVFVFCGDGAGRNALLTSCEGLPNVHFLHLQPMERLCALLAMADIHLLPQRSEAADLVMPSKLTGMLSSGKPVVATAQATSMVGKLVEKCGLIVPPGDAAGMAQAIVDLAEQPQMRLSLGQSGRHIAQVHFEREAVLSLFNQQLERLAAGLPPTQRIAALPQGESWLEDEEEIAVRTSGKDH
jgi:colanic acid biosynthesis glycosyl transferase WcaI